MVFSMFIFALLASSLASCNQGTSGGGCAGSGKNGGKTDGSGNTVSSIKYGHAGVYVFEFQSNGQFIWYYADIKLDRREAYKGSYKILGDNIYCTITWITPDFNTGWEIGKRFYFAIRSNDQITMHINSEVLPFYKISGGNLIYR